MADPSTPGTPKVMARKESSGRVAGLLCQSCIVASQARKPESPLDVITPLRK